MKELLKSSQDGVKIKLRIKAILIALFPLTSALLRQFTDIELLEADWVYLSEQIAVVVSIVLEVWGWLRVKSTVKK